MNKEEIKALVAKMLGELQKNSGGSTTNPESNRTKGTVPGEPPVKAGDYKPTEPIGTELLEDLSELDLRKQYAVEQPVNGKAFCSFGSRASRSPISYEIHAPLPGGPCRRQG